MYNHLPSPVDFVFRFRYRLRCLFETSEKNSAMGTSFFFNTKMTENYMRILAFLYVQIWTVLWGLFRANNIVANFWMLFATLSAYGVVTSEVGPGWTGRLLRTSLASRFLGNLQSWFLGFFTTTVEVIFRLGFVFAFIASLSLAWEWNHRWNRRSLTPRWFLLASWYAFLFKMGNRFLSSL